MGQEKELQVYSHEKDLALALAPLPYIQRLAELLEDEQQPFDLEAYLLERGCSPSNTTTTVGCFSSNCKTKKKKKKKKHLLLLTTTTSPTSFGLRSSNIRKTLCQKTFRSHHHHHHHHVRDDGNMEEPERLSSSAAAASSSTEFDETTTTPHDQLDSPAASILDATQTQTQTHQSNNKSATDRVTMTQWTTKEDNKQCSPDSVLDQIQATPPVHKHVVISSSQGVCPSTSSHSLFKKPTEDGILSASLWDLIVTTEEQGISGSNHNHTSSSSTYIISSVRALQQTKQLLFDCVREAVESQGRMRNTRTGHFMGTENLGNFICERIRVWNTRSATGENITRLQTSDLLAFFHEWDYLEDHRSDVIQQVGDQILEEIKDEIVEELIAFYTCNK
ncbi:hypothetical protein V2J09_007472 [Rumex salicifolius]